MTSIGLINQIGGFREEASALMGETANDRQTVQRLREEHKDGRLLQAVDALHLTRDVEELIREEQRQAHDRRKEEKDLWEQA